MGEVGVGDFQGFDGRLAGERVVGGGLVEEAGVVELGGEVLAVSFGEVSQGFGAGGLVLVLGDFQDERKAVGVVGERLGEELLGLGLPSPWSSAKTPFA